MAKDGVAEKKLTQHDRKPTDEEAELFRSICLSNEPFVLTPVLVNNQERFALAELITAPCGARVVRILAFLPIPGDDIPMSDTSQKNKRARELNPRLN